MVKCINEWTCCNIHQNFLKIYKFNEESNLNQLIFNRKTGKVEASKEWGWERDCRVPCSYGSWIPEKACRGKLNLILSALHCYTYWYNNFFFCTLNRAVVTPVQMSSVLNKKQQRRSNTWILKLQGYLKMLEACFWNMWQPSRTEACFSTSIWENKLVCFSVLEMFKIYVLYSITSELFTQSYPFQWHLNNQYMYCIWKFVLSFLWLVNPRSLLPWL